MIELRQVTFAYAERTILDRVDLDIDEAELVLVAGPTGSGKSTLLGVLTGLVPRFTGGRLTGDLRLDGRSVLGRPPRERGGRSMAQFATHAAGTQVELLTAVCADRWRVDADVAALGAVAKVIATALEPDPGRRFGSALEFRRALRAALGTR